MLLNFQNITKIAFNFVAKKITYKNLLKNNIENIKMMIICLIQNLFLILVQWEYNLNKKMTQKRKNKEKILLKWRLLDLINMNYKIVILINFFHNKNLNKKSLKILQNIFRLRKNNQEKHRCLVFKMNILIKHKNLIRDLKKIWT